MLNRRYLRIKAMQNVFAYFQCKQSDFYLAIDLIKEEFAPDLNSMEVQDPVKLDANKKAASQLFTNSYEQRKLAGTENFTEEQAKAAQDALVYYERLIQQDQAHLRKTMVLEAEKLAERYLLFLLLLPELSEYISNERDKRIQLGKKHPIDESNFIQNKVIKLLYANKPLELAAIKQNLHWKEEQDFVKQLYKEAIREDQEYLDYLKKENLTFEEDKEFVLNLVKKIIFKSELVNLFMEERDLYWAENKEVLKSMVIRTIKSIEEGMEDNMELAELSYNWEEDKEFFVDLYSLTIKGEKEFEEMISSKSKNWDVERLAALDRVILMMALAEMINFPSIPVKVTINEYIELAKKYSTPKSKFFVNGVLDVLSNELIEKGVIRKSGRGLIDNK